MPLQIKLCFSPHALSTTQLSPCHNIDSAIGCQPTPLFQRHTAWHRELIGDLRWQMSFRIYVRPICSSFFLILLFHPPPLTCVRAYKLLLCSVLFFVLLRFLFFSGDWNLNNLAGSTINSDRVENSFHAWVDWRSRDARVSSKKPYGKS